MSPDDRDGGDRPRLSWAEIDKRRDRPSERSEPRGPRGKAAEARSQHATQRYLKQLDNLFESDSGGSAGAELVKALRDAHGTPGLADACRAYRDALGVPEDPDLLTLFLDARDREIVMEALQQLARIAANLQAPRGLRSQLQVLVEDVDDDVAIAAEDVLRDLS